MIRLDGLRVYTISELGQYLDCPRKYQYGYAKALDSKGFQGVPLNVGTAIHQGVADIYAGVDATEAVASALETYDISTGKWWLEAEPGTKTWQKLVTGKEQIRACLAEYPWAASDFDQTEAIEESFVVPMGQGRAYAGRWDRSVVYGGDDFLSDTKTTGSALDQIAKEQKMRMQYKAYAYAWRVIKGKKIRGFIMDFVKKPRVNFRKDGTLSSVSTTDFLREPTYIKEHDYELFPAWFHRVTEAIETDEDTLLRQGGQQTPIMPYPLNTGTCHKWNRFCEFFELCQLGYLSDKLECTMFKQKESLHGQEYLDELSPEARAFVTSTSEAVAGTERDSDSNGPCDI